MTKLFETAKKQETAILIALVNQKQNQEMTRIYLEELAFLAETRGIKVIHSFTQKLDRADSGTFVGKGKLEEIVTFVKNEEIDIVIFDDDLSPAQVRNLEKALNGDSIEEARIKVLDRSLLILDIFSYRAQTTQARTQVELAQYQYMLPRLTRMWTHLSKQKGGVGMRGPGEKELETDKRIIKDRISFLKEKLEKIEKQNETRRKARELMVRVALVGYTNVGKSTIMNLLSKAEVFAENKLFATVDSTVRKVVFDNIPFLLTDTVGFIRKLPTTLIESFKSTLSEITEADILIHVVDISTDHYEEQIMTVNKILAEIKANDKDTLMVYNKTDLYRNEVILDEEGNEIKEKIFFADQAKNGAIFISALKKDNVSELRNQLIQLVSKKYYTIFPNYL